MNKSEAVMEQPQSGNDRAELQVGAETVSYNRTLPQAPPPYTPTPYSVPGSTDGEPQVIHQTIIVQAPLKNGPITYNCPACRERIVTTVEYINSKKTHLVAGFICGLTLWCSLCCLAAIPYFTSTFKEAVHYCPNCKTFLGSYSKI